MSTHAVLWPCQANVSFSTETENSSSSKAKPLVISGLNMNTFNWNPIVEMPINMLMSPLAKSDYNQPIDKEQESSQLGNWRNAFPTTTTMARYEAINLKPQTSTLHTIRSDSAWLKWAAVMRLELYKMLVTTLAAAGFGTHSLCPKPPPPIPIVVGWRLIQ